ncbi:MAG: helix-turn-helix transcriptional regulator [Polyangiaceae bacterium]|nr:helix-turn-helix transcriptional regulator [Polyangiaceae bacterium]
MASKHRRNPDPLAREVGERIRRMRKEREFSFDAFVEETGLGRGYISELERGLVVPSLTTLAIVARTLDLTIADLVLGHTDRELLFAELRTASVAQLRRMRADHATSVERRESGVVPRTVEVKKPRQRVD